MKYGHIAFSLFNRGGWNGGGQDGAIVFDTVSRNFTDLGVTYLNDLGNSDGGYSYSREFTQIGGVLYTLEDGGDCIHAYDLETLTFHELDTTVPSNTAGSACMASSATPSPRLYINGGHGSFTALQVRSNVNSH